MSEGSVDYVKLVDFLSSDDILVNDGNGGKIELWKKSQEAVLRKNYGIDSEIIVKIQEKLKNGQALTASEQKIIDNFASEFAAHETQYLLGNEDFIDKIVARDSSFAKKLLQKVENLKQAFKRVGNKEGQKEYKQLHEAEKLYLKAAAKAGNMQIQRFILAHSPDLEKEIDVSTEIKYNKKTPYIQWESDALAWANKSTTSVGDMGIGHDSRFTYIYEATDADGDGHATDYIVIKKISSNNQKIINDWYQEVKVNNERNHASVYESADEYGRERRRYKSNSSNVLGESTENGRIGSVYQVESESNGKSNNQKGDRNRQIKYSLKEEAARKVFNESLDKWDKKDTSILFNVGKSSTVLKELVVNGKQIGDKNILFNSSKVVKILNEHKEITIDTIKQIPDIISNPIICLKAKNFDTRIVMFGEVYGTNGKPVMVALELNPTSRKGISLDDVTVVSAYTRSNTQNLINSSEVLYIDSNKKRISRWENLNGLQLPVDNPETNSNNSISQNSENATENAKKTEIKYSLKEDTSGKQLSARQKEYFKDSKVVDQNGKLQVVYHGTEGDFYVYDKSLRGESTGAKDAKLGFFFTNSKMVALSYAINAYDNKMFTLKHKIANGDRNILEKLTYKNGYQDLAMTDDVKEFARLQDKGERLDHDIQELYLNIKNPLETDWKGKAYKNEAMLKIIKRALLLGNDGVIIRNIEDSFDNNFGISDVFVAFEPNQIKLTTNVNPTINEDIRFSLKESNYAERNPSTVTEKEFNHHYWAIASNLLSKKEIGTLNSSVAKLKNGEFFNKNADGFYLIPVGENGIYNKIVLTDGKFNSYSIDTVIEIQLDNETDLDNARRLIYEQAKYDISTENSELFKVYYSKDFKFSDFTEKLQNNRKNSGVEQNGTRSNREIKFSLKEDGLSKKYRKEASTWKEKYYEAEKRNSEINKLLDSVQKIKNLKKGTFINASEYRADIFKKSIDTLANIKFRGDLNKSGTRDIAAGLIEWYTKENPILGYVNEKETGYYVPEVAEMLADVATGKGKLTTQEIRNLKNVVDHLTHVAESYNKVWRNGKYVEAQPIAKEYVAKMKNSQRTQVGWLKKYFEKYLTAFADPMTVARYFDKYSNGFYSEMMVALRDAATDAQIDEMNIREPIEDFIKRNKKYFAEAKKKKVNYNGHDIPLLTAIYVYMALNDTGIIPTLAKSGFVFYDGDFKGRIDGFAQNEDIEFTAMKEQAKVVQSSLEKQFSAADKEYIQIVRKIFNEDCRQRYIDTSLRLKGYYNLKEGDYIPIWRANVAINVDTSAYEFEANRVSNASFTKERAKGAIGEIRADGLNDVVDRHIRAVSQYAKIAPAIEEYNKLLNLNTVENKNKPVSVSTESHNVWAQGVEYFKKLISDIQGIPASKDSSVVVSRLRSSYAKFQLGANPKVWVTQLSSFFASGSILDFSSVIKGLTINANDVDTYCELAKLRNNENVAAMAQGVLDKVDKFGNALMKPIGVVDRFVIKRLFGACQVQIEKSIGLKIGTQENKVKAGELLKKVILETQQNSMATERSAAMRSGSEFNKTITMFSADSMKVIGRVVDSIGEYTTLNAKLKTLTDANEITAVQKKIAESGKKVAKSVTSLITSAVFMALVAQLFRTLYNKNDEDDNVVADVTTDAIGNLLGGLPYIKEIYGRFVDGYEIDGYAYSAINDMLDSTYNVFKLSGDIVTGNVTTQDIAKNIKKSVFAAGQLFGLPTRNVYNIAYGLTKRISPTAAYKVDTAFYNKGYSSDLKKAIDNDDDDMIATIVELMTNERVGNIGDSNVSKELNSLVTKGFDVIPRSVGKTITYDGEEKTLTNNQRAQFKQVYSIANKAVASLIKLSQYEKATDEVKAKAIKYIYNVYYNLALEDLLGVDLETKTVLFAEAIDVEKLAIIIAMANSLTADTDKQGKAISGTKKKKIQAYVNSLRLSAAQKYMIMGYLGFKNLNGEDTVKAYINRLKLTKSEKEKLLKYSGYGQ